MKNITYTILFTITLNCNDISKHKSLDNLTTEQLLQELAKSEKKLKKEENKTKAVIQLSKTVDKLAKTLNVD